MLDYIKLYIDIKRLTEDKCLEKVENVSERLGLRFVKDGHYSNFNMFYSTPSIFCVNLGTTDLHRITSYAFTVLLESLKGYLILDSLSFRLLPSKNSGRVGYVGLHKWLTNKGYERVDISTSTFLFSDALNFNFGSRAVCVMTKGFSHLYNWKQDPSTYESLTMKIVEKLLVEELRRKSENKSDHI